MQEEVKAFILEGFELLDEFESDLVALESTSHDPAVIARIFRAVHTIKGTGGMLGFTTIDAVAHVGETYLAAVREGLAKIDQAATDALLGMSDRLREELVCIESTGKESGADYQETVRRLVSVTPATEPLEAPPSVPHKSKKSSSRKRRGKTLQVEAPPKPSAQAPAEDVTADADHNSPAERLDTPRAETPAAEAPAAEAPAAEMNRPNEQPSRSPASPPAPSEGPSIPKAPRDAGSPSTSESSATPDPATNTVHVRVDVLDNLINLVGELVLVRNRMLSMPDTDKAAVGGPAVQRLDAIASFLQEEVMKTRMQPIGSIWARMPRMVRDVAIACGKRVELHMDGAETELDRTVLEAINAPLTHLIRNAIDHGIEPPLVRESAGKDRTGQLSLRAYHGSGQVTIAISDDGVGIDLQKLRRAAVEKGLLSAAEATEKPDSEIMELIFVSGMSTAESVTRVSGRGVGMDVARANVARLGGSVDVSTAPGKGTTVKLRIPLTLTIVPALIVSVGRQRFAIPQTNVAELLHPGSEDGESVRTERVGNSSVLRHRGALIPVVDMNKLLDLPAAVAEEDEGSDMVILHAHEQHFAAIVDRVLDSQEIVVKPLDERIGALGLFSGGTILGDGAACLIIDTVGLAKITGVIAEAREMNAADARVSQPEERVAANPVLLLGGADDGRLVMPLDEVVHLRRVEVSSIEYAAGKKVLQFQDDILPLVSLAELLPERRMTPRNAPAADGEEGDSQVCVVICTDGKRTGGLLVDSIIDVVDAPAGELRAASRPGVKGTLILDGKICEMLDVQHILEVTSD